jgi:pantetheine-phosphate adenylyltransferase
MDIIERATRLFDEVILVVSTNMSKQSSFSVEDRVALLNKLYQTNSQIKIVAWPGLTVEAAKKYEASAIIRGLRIVSDFEYEFQMNLANNVLDSSIETIFLMTKTENAFISSSMVREVHRLGGDVSSFVPKDVIQFLDKQKDR